MAETVRELAILFADIADSATLYERLGDRRGREVTKSCLDSAIEAGVREGGVLVKTIGDEALLRFETATAAVRGAWGIQQAISAGAAGPMEGAHPLAVKIGIHAGPVILENADVFGDVVNVASRMVGLARPRQILVTGDVARAIAGGSCPKTRHVDTMYVKGRQEAVPVHEVLWEPESTVTELVQAHEPQQSGTETWLELETGSERRVLRSGARLTFGRSPQCQLVVDAPRASRIHASLEYRRGKFVLTDQSTNGTYVHFADGERFYVRREEIPLLADGYLTLGEAGAPSSPGAVAFRVRSGEPEGAG